MYDTLIVGAGLFGSIIAATLRKDGQKVAVIDANLGGSGSKAAACLMRPSWFSSLGKAVYGPSLKLLEELYGVEDVLFQVRPLLKEVSVHWVRPSAILKKADFHARVQSLGRDGKKWLVHTLDNTYCAKRVVVAAGIWTPELIQVQKGLVGKAGLACLWPKESIKTPFIRVWAPYKQVVGFNRGDGVWVGDGNAINSDRWDESYARATVKRCVDGAQLKGEPVKILGVRPYSPVSPCYLREERPGLWVATGGAKNGTLAAGWCASEIRKAFQ